MYKDAGKIIEAGLNKQAKQQICKKITTFLDCLPTKLNLTLSRVFPIIEEQLYNKQS